MRQNVAISDVLLACTTLAVVAALALPSWSHSTLHGRREEALSALRTISKLQAEYHAEHQRYSDSFAELGFSPKGRRIYNNQAARGETYNYALSTWEHGGLPSGNYRATASGNLDSSDGILDIIIIENELTVAGKTVDADSPIILSDDISKTTTRVASSSDSSGAFGYRGRIEGIEGSE